MKNFISRQLHFIVINFLLMVGIISAQDDPNFDNTFGMELPETYPVESPLGRVVITSDEGFDNFLIGVDFAEPHISSNPLTSTEYFTAFNTNNTHFTYDGVEWFFQIPGFGFVLRGDPATAYDSLGNLYYENMYGSANILGCKLVVSTDNGATWSPAVTSISGNDKNWIAADQSAGPYSNYVYTTMSSVNSHVVARSTDFGATWTQTGTFNSNSRLPGAMVAVGANVIGGDVSGGAVYVVTNHTSTFASQYSFFLSTDGGASWTLKSTQQFANYVGTNVNGRHSVENMRTRPYPFIAADNSYGPFRGRLYLVYASNNPVGNGNKPDIYCRYSDDQGASWSSAVTVNDDPNSQANHQWMPATWCDKESGRLYIKWFDTRNISTSDSAEVYASYSDDGGITWAENQDLSTSKFKIDCSTCGGGGTPRYQGDYDAITSNRITSMSAWSDFRNGGFGSYVAYFPDFAMTISENADTISTTDSLEITIKIPAVKLYDHSVTFSATVSPQANFIFEFPDGDSLSSYPDSLTMLIIWNNIPEDSYTISIDGAGPNGTPVHRRTVDLLVTDGTTTVLQPNGSEELITGSVYSIMWEKIFVDTVKLEYSTDGGSTWIIITDGVYKKTRSVGHPKSMLKMGKHYDGIESSAQFNWIIPNTISSNCLVRISDSNDPSVFDVSDTTFSILSAPLPIWRLLSSGIDSTVLCVDIVDTLLAWAGTKGGMVLKTTNGGNTWNVTSSALGGDVYSISAIDNQKAIVLVNSSGSARIRRTASFGITWTTAYEDNSSGAFLNAVHMFDEDNGYVLGDPVNGEWTLLRTSDKGENWTSASTLPQNGSETGWSNSMDWIGMQYGWFGTDNGGVYSTVDSGVTWLNSPTSFTNSMAVAFTEEQNGIAGGDGTDRTTDGGATWSLSPDQVPGTVFSGSAIKRLPGRWYFISGTEVYRSFNQGDSFVIDYAQTNVFQHLKMKVVTAGDNEWICGYAVGNNGTIAKFIEPYTVTQAELTTDLVPSEFSMAQNYPNPFNPSTSIEFSVPVYSAVTLTIYNLLGQAVKTLVNEEISAGNYNVVWNGEDQNGLKVSSGVYLYKMQANGTNGNDFQQIRKMVLLK